MTNSTAPRRPATRLRSTPRPAPRTRVIDEAGVVWEHANPLHLCRWLAGRNELLRTIAARAGGD